MDLNVDLGELPDEPAELYALATVVNIACCGHAGDDASMRAAVRAARAAGARIAAHPSYADREGFGRRPAFADPDVVGEQVRAQCASLAAIAREAGAHVTHVKPHGALYHDAAADPERAGAVVAAAREVLGADVVVVGPPEGALLVSAVRAGLGYAREGFADRGYDARGALRPRGTPGAMIEDPDVAAAQAVELALRGGLDTLCVHGDTPGAVAIASAVRAALEREGCLPPRA